jgi:hypothetical protein
VSAIFIALTVFSCQKENLVPQSTTISFKGTLSIVETIEVYNCNPIVMIQSSNEILEMKEVPGDSIKFSVANCMEVIFKKNHQDIYTSDLIEGHQTKILLHNDSIDFLQRQIVNDGKSFKETKWLFVGREIK